jgi:hypothetical protein
LVGMVQGDVSRETPDTRHQTLKCRVPNGSMARRRICQDWGPETIDEAASYHDPDADLWTPGRLCGCASEHC